MKIKNLISLGISTVFIFVVLHDSLLSQVQVASKSKEDLSKWAFPLKKSLPAELLNRISIDLKNVPLGKALKVISKKGNIELLFSETFIPVGRIVSVRLENGTAAEALQQVLAQTATDYAITNAGQIVLIPTEYRTNSSLQTPRAPNIQLNGIVVDEETGETLLGANVYIKGETIGTAAGQDGRFSFGFDTDDDFTLVVSYLGYKKFEKSYSPNDNLLNLRITLSRDLFLTEEVVVTGIASKTSKAVAEVAVSRIQASELTEIQTYQDLSQMLSGKVAGVNIKATSGNPGAGFRFNIRSGGGLNGNGQPVVYVDGARVDNTEFNGVHAGGAGISLLVDLNPEDIENIEILKGPAGAASYGTGGSNGVILITTKRGKLAAGKEKGVNINYKFVAGLNTPAHTYPKNEWWYYTVDQLNNLHKNGRITQNSLSASGGTGVISYYVSLDKRYEEGLMPTGYMDRSTVRANIDAFPSEKLTLRVSTAYSNHENERPRNDNSSSGWIWSMMTVPAYANVDSIGIAKIDNMINSTRFMGSFDVTWSPIKNLEAHAALGIDDGAIRNYEFLSPAYAYRSIKDGQKTIITRLNRQNTYSGHVKYTYSPLAELTVTSTVGAQLFERRNRETYSRRQDYVTEAMSELEGGESYIAASEDIFHEKEAGIFTDHAFSYLDQYFFSFMVRKDYASSFGKKVPSIIYPRASFAWRLDKYDFIPSAFDLLKVRAAYGETGVLPGGTWGIPALWGTDNSGYGIGIQLSGIGNEEIKPERIKELEFGFEAELFRNYSVEFTYYRQNSEDSIVPFSNPPSTGLVASPKYVNIGKVEGWGVESLIQARPIHTRNFELNLTLLNSYQENEVTDMGGAPDITAWRGVNVIKEGLSKYAFYHWKLTSPVYNSEGKYSKAGHTDDYFYLGTPIPPYTGSFSINARLFKRLNISLLTEWATGHMIQNYTYRLLIGEKNNLRFRQLDDLLNIYDYFPEQAPLAYNTPEYEAAAIERMKYDRSTKINFMEDADFLKLREISINYSLRDLLPKLGLEKSVSDLVVGVSARNVFTLTGYQGPNVEVNYMGGRAVGNTSSIDRGIDMTTMMMPRVYNFWFRLSL